MSTLEFKTANRLKAAFRKHNAYVEPLPIVSVPFPESLGGVMTFGHALYDLYRAERIAQGWEEWKWESLSDPQRLVWDRVAAKLQGQP